MDIESILRKTLKPALRCTEPVAISLGVADKNGIVADTAENTIRNLKRLNQSMPAAEDGIIQIMQEKIAPVLSPGIKSAARLGESP